LAKSKEKEVEKEGRMRQIKSLAIELSQSPNSEVRTLAKLNFIVAEEIVDLLLGLLYEKGGEFPNIKAVFKVQSQFNASLVDALWGAESLDERLRKIEYAKPTETPKKKELTEQQEKLAQHMRTLEDLELWSQGRIADWVRKRFGGDSSDEQQR
jgi:hypothetical protein